MLGFGQVRAEDLLDGDPTKSIDFILTLPEKIHVH